MGDKRFKLLPWFISSRDFVILQYRVAIGLEALDVMSQVRGQSTLLAYILEGRTTKTADAVLHGGSNLRCPRLVRYDGHTDLRVLFMLLVVGAVE